MMLRPCFSCQFADVVYLTKDRQDEFGCAKKFRVHGKNFLCVPDGTEYDSFKEATPEKHDELVVYRFKGIIVEDV